MIKVAPSLLSADFGNLSGAVKLMCDSGADMLHIDIMDGSFVPNLTLGPKAVADIKKHSTVPLDVHLMIYNPENHIDAFIKAGASNITIHVESTNLVLQTLEKIKEKNIKASIVLNPNTPVESVVPAFDYVDMILVMGVYPGFGGQNFIPQTLQRISSIKQLLCNRKVDIQIDGGVTLLNAFDIVKAGANILVAGNTIFSASDPKSVIQKLKNVK